jgi:hypothetical protein
MEIQSGNKIAVHVVKENGLIIKMCRGRWRRNHYFDIYSRDAKSLDNYT